MRDVYAKPPAVLLATGLLGLALVAVAQKPNIAEEGLDPVVTGAEEESESSGTRVMNVEAGVLVPGEALAQPPKQSPEAEALAQLQGRWERHIAGERAIAEILIVDGNRDTYMRKWSDGNLRYHIESDIQIVTEGDVLIYKRHVTDFVKKTVGLGDVPVDQAFILRIDGDVFYEITGLLHGCRDMRKSAQVFPWRRVGRAKPMARPERPTGKAVGAPTAISWLPGGRPFPFLPVVSTRETQTTIITDLVAQPPADYVLRYALDADGEAAEDASRNGLSGRIHGAETTPGVFGAALAFDGVSDHIEGPELRLDSFSFAAWVSPTDDSINNRRVLLLDGGTQGYVSIQGNSRGGLGTYVDLTGEHAIEMNDYDHKANPGKWTHVGVTFHGGKCKLYVNGRVSARTEAALKGEATGKLYVGGTDRHRGGYWRGAIDEVVVFGRALSDAEMASLMLIRKLREE